MIVDKIKKSNLPEETYKTDKPDIPIGKWVKCNKCKEILYKEDLHNNMSICPNCGNHFRLSSRRRLVQIVDAGTFEEFKLDIKQPNPLKMEDYEKKLKALQEKTGLEEAVICGTRKNRRRKSCNMHNGCEFPYGKYGICCWRKNNIFNRTSN